jgi:hypothetical protein
MPLMWRVRNEPVNQGVRDPAVSIESGVEDRDFEAGGAAAGNRQRQHRGPLIPAQTAGEPIVDCRHDRVVEDIDIGVNPEISRLSRYSSPNRMNGRRSVSGPRCPSWVGASGGDTPARTADPRLSTALGHSACNAGSLWVRRTVRAGPAGTVVVAGKRGWHVPWRSGAVC